MVLLHRSAEPQNDRPSASSLWLLPARLFHRTSLKFTAPLIVAGVGTAVVLGITSNGSSASSNADQSLTPQPSNSTHLTVSHTTDSSAQTTPQSTTNTGGNSVRTNVQSSTNTSDSSTSVTVNGQPVAVPANGTVSKTITGPDGSTSISVTATNNSDASNSFSSSTSLSVSTNSSSSSSDDSSQYAIGGSN